MSNRNIQRLLNVVDHNLMNRHATMTYERVTTAITRLANYITESDTTEETWWLGESNYIDLTTLLTGAYWHYTEWHGGQSSPEYEALCALGNIYSPNMEQPDPENDAYLQLDQMAGEAL